MSHTGEASLHINMAQLIAKGYSNRIGEDATETAAAAQIATAYAIAGLAEAVLHLADQVAARGDD